jgi:Rieske Fe-S protein
MNWQKLKRRRFISGSLKLSGLVGAGGFLYSLFRYMTFGDMSDNLHLSKKDNPGEGVAAVSPGSDRALSSNRSSIEISARAISPGEAKTVAIGDLPVIVVHHDDGFKAFIAICTHLGCLVQWHKDTEKFVCPCHAGTYDSEGEVISGPPPAALKECCVEENGETLRIYLG